MFVLTKTIVSSTATLAIASATRRSPRPLAPDERSVERNRAVRAGADERADSDGQAQTVRTLPSRRTASGGAFVERSQARLTTSSQEQRSATGRLDRPPASGSPDAEVAECGARHAPMQTNARTYARLLLEWDAIPVARPGGEPTSRRRRFGPRARRVDDKALDPRRAR